MRLNNRAQISDDTSLGYSQLKPAATSLRQSVGSASSILNQSQANLSSTSVGDVSRRILRCLSKPSIVTMQKKPRHRKQPRTEELEELLLLSEPTSPRNTIILDNDEQNTSTLTLTPPIGEDNVQSNATAILSACIVSGEDDIGSGNSSSDSSTDIDAAVDEYLQKEEVKTSGPLPEKVLRIPSQESFQLSLILIGCYFLGILLCMIALNIHSIILFGAGIISEYI